MGYLRLALVLSVLGCVKLSEGFQCYNCAYTELAGTNPGDESCKASSKPDDALLQDCPIGFCVKIVVEGTVKTTDIPFKTAMRLCMPNLNGEEFVKESLTGTAKEVAAKTKNSSVKATLDSLALALNDATEALAMTCNEDKCNGDGGGEDESDDNGGAGIGCLSLSVLIGMIVAMHKLF